MADGVCRLLQRLYLRRNLAHVFQAATLHTLRTTVVSRGLCTFVNRGKTAESIPRKFVLGYDNIPELESGPENVKRIFSLSNANQLGHRKVARHEIQEKYSGKKEQHIAELTLKINTLTKHCQEKPKDKHNKVFLQWVVDQRNKKLKSLKASQFGRYLELIKELEIPPLESPHSKWNKYKFRKFKIGVKVEKKQSFLERKMIK